jgi:diguanylate cyclase (GGDEF)-like protein
MDGGCSVVARPENAVPRAFVALTTLTAVAAVVSVGAVASIVGWRLDHPASFAALGLLVLVGELRPIPVPRRHGLDKVTVSTAFAFAALLSSGILPACLVYAGSSVIADLVARTAPIKVLFNAAQYVLSAVCAGAILIGVAGGAPVALHAGAVPAIVLAAVAWWGTNHVLAGTGAAFLARLPVAPYLRDDLAFHALIAGSLLTLAPALVASSAASFALIPVVVAPVLAIYFGGRQAGINAHHAFHDRLTDLPNRWLLYESLEKKLQTAEHGHHHVAVMIVDLDDFKSINDTLGHEFGDRVLQQIAPRLRDALGPRGLLARLGGDEFAAVLDGVHDEAEALSWAEQLLVVLQRPCEIDSMVLHIAGSIGVACYPQHGRSADELLRHADVALYCAKSERSTCRLYAREHDEHSIDRLALAAQLGRGIERGELVVHYQPKVPLTEGGTCGVEALVRWNHPQLGSIGPEAFIPISEHTGLIKGVTERVLDASLRQCRAWRTKGLNIRFSVNISTRTLLDHDLPATIRTLLHRYRVPAASLQLEITESRFVADLGRARTVLHELRAMGVTIAIDDFGTGFSSLAQLQQLPVDEIKIDRSFVMRMETDRDDAVLVHSIIELAHNLGLHVTAEGVETPATDRILRDMGCDFAQGYYVSRPVPADECRRVLSAIASQADKPPMRLVTLDTAMESA